MTHLDAETLQRAIDGELDPDAAARARAHRDECPECAERWEAARAEEQRLASLLGALDHDVPGLDPPWLAVGAGRTGTWRSRAAAAVAILVVAGGLAWAIPGSPIPAWVRSVLRGDGEATPAEAGPTPVEPASGVAVDPGDSLDVAFEHSQEAGQVRVVRTASGPVTIRILGPAPDLRVETHRVGIANAGSSASYRVEIPDAAPLVRVTVAGRVVLEKRGPDARTSAPADSGLEYAFPLR